MFPEVVGTAVLVTGAAEHSEVVGIMALEPSTTAKFAQLMRVLFG